MPGISRGSSHNRDLRLNGEYAGWQIRILPRLLQMDLGSRDGARLLLFSDQLWFERSWLASTWCWIFRCGLGGERVEMDGCVGVEVNVVFMASVD